MDILFLPLVFVNFRVRVKLPQSPHASQVSVMQTHAYLLSLCSMKQLPVGVFLVPLDGMRVLGRVTPSITFAGTKTHSYTWVERGTSRSKMSCPRTQHNVPAQLCLGSGPLYSIQSPMSINKTLGQFPHFSDGKNGTLELSANP